MNVTIRSARCNDAEEIGRVHYRAWIETYTGMLPESCLAARSEEKSIQFFSRSECKNIAVAEVDGEIIGFCGYGEFRDTSDDMIGEIQGIYLLDACKRMGIGRKLMAYALERLSELGNSEVGLWVLDANERAIRFYEALGFAYSGRYKDADLGEIVRELFYTKKLPIKE